MSSTTEAPRASLPTPRTVATAAVVMLALLTASCGAPPAPMNPGSRQTVPTHGPGAQPTAPRGSVSVPELPQLGGDVELPYRTPGEQPEDPGPVVVVPTTTAPPTLIPSDTEPTPTMEPSEQLPIPEVP